MTDAAAAALESIVWEGGWIQVKVPLPFSLRWVNSYLLPEKNGYTLIDPGLHTSEAAAGWESALKRHGIAFEEIKQIVLTHQHPDHYGLAGWFQERTQAQVFMSQAAHDYTRRLWGEERTFAAELTALYKRNGMPEQYLLEITPHLESFVSKVTPQPEVAYIEEGDRLTMGGLQWEILGTPGHARGHLCFYQRGSRLMFCGDQVLPDITPNISVVPGDDDNPLLSYLSSLDVLKTYEVQQAFPGHRDPFRDFAVRITELQEHHSRRLAIMKSWLDTDSMTGYEVCVRHFGARIGGNIHNLRFAMSETLAHLDYLVHQRKAAAAMKGSVVYYQSTQ